MNRAFSLIEHSRRFRSDRRRARARSSPIFRYPCAQVINGRATHFAAYLELSLGWCRVCVKSMGRHRANGPPPAPELRAPMQPQRNGYIWPPFGAPTERRA
jgi:hypothetical protein